MLNVIVHVILAVVAYFSCAMLFDTDRGRINPVFLPLIWIFFGLPSVLCGSYLHSRGHDTSAIITFLIAGGIGVLKAISMGRRRP